MRTLFIDAAFLIGLLRVDDEHHAQAVALFDQLSKRPQVRFVTTYLILAEVLAYVSRGSANIRAAAVEQADQLLERADCDVIEVTPELFARGLDLYRARPDKRYSLADCVSMVVCADLSITEVLTADTDFESEGLEILLKD